MQITDVHYDFNNDKKQQTLDMLDFLIEDNKPDLIIMTGDWTSEREETEYHSRKVFETLNKHNIPWTVVFGNHDDEGVLTKYDYADILKEYENCLFNPGVSNIKGVGNYVINVYEDSFDGNIVQSLVLIDSHRAVRYGTTKYDYLSKDQIEWYKWNIRNLNEIYQKQDGNESEILPSMMFQHVPLHEYKDAYEQAVNTENLLLGVNNEDVWPPYKNTGMFDAILEMKSTKAVFAGHDHDNYSVSLYKGVQLVYGVESGWCKEYATMGKKGCLTVEMSKNGKVNVKHCYYDLANK